MKVLFSLKLFLASSKQTLKKFQSHGISFSLFWKQAETHFVQTPCKKEGVDQFNTFWNVVDFSVLELLN